MKTQFLNSQLKFLFLLSLLSGGVQANLLTNGSFEQGVFTGGSFGYPLAEQLTAGSGTINGWVTDTEELAWFKSGQAGILTQDGSFALDLTGFCDLGNNCGSSSVYGGIHQTVATNSGTQYHLSFYAGNYLDNSSQPTLTVSAGSTSGSFPLAATNLSYGNWVQYGIDFVASSANTTIAFGGTGGGKGGTFYLGLDNVDLTVSPVPVPAAIWLLGSGLVGLTGFRKRKTALIQ